MGTFLQTLHDEAPDAMYSRFRKAVVLGFWALWALWSAQNQASQPARVVDYLGNSNTGHYLVVCEAKISHHIIMYMHMITH